MISGRLAVQISFGKFKTRSIIDFYMHFDQHSICNRSLSDKLNIVQLKGTILCLISPQPIFDIEMQPRYIKFQPQTIENDIRPRAKRRGGR